MLFKSKIYEKVKKNEITKKSKIYTMNFFRYIPKDKIKIFNKNSKKKYKTKKFNTKKKRN